MGKAMLRHRLNMAASSPAAGEHVRPPQGTVDRVIHAAAMLSFGFLLTVVPLVLCYGAAAIVFRYVYGVRLPTPFG